MSTVREGRFIEAAGAVTFRPDGNVLLVHRPEYDDWSLPKGKKDHDEYTARTAVREVAEEGAVDIRLGVPLSSVQYMTDKGSKRVHFWRAKLLAEESFKPNSEIDDIAWLTPNKAIKRLSYADERHVLEQALDTPETTPLVIVRHGKAMDRKNWSGKDSARPLTARGRKQSDDLVKLLDAYGVQAILSSSSERCVKTLRPYARQLRSEVETWSVLSEEFGIDNPKDVAKFMRRRITDTVKHERPQVISGHRPVLPVMFKSLGIEPRSIVPGTAIVAHLDAKGTLRAAEWHKPLR